jgi:hypothetical protein
MYLIGGKHAFVVYVDGKRTRETTRDFPGILFQPRSSSRCGFVEMEKIMLDMFTRKIQAGNSYHFYKVWSN